MSESLAGSGAYRRGPGIRGLFFCVCMNTLSATTSANNCAGGRSRGANDCLATTEPT